MPATLSAIEVSAAATNRAGRRHHIPVPWPEVPGILVLSFLVSILASAEVFAIWELFHARSRKRSRGAGLLSRRVSSVVGALSPVGGSSPTWPSSASASRSLVGIAFRGVLALLAARLAQRFVRTMRASLALMNPYEERLDADLEERLATLREGPWGEGLPKGPQPGEWRQWLHTGRGAQETLEELHATLGLLSRKKENMTLEQLTEGVRRVLTVKYVQVSRSTKRFWSQEQARSIARALATDLGLAAAATPDEGTPGGGALHECVPWVFNEHLPWTTPRWLQVCQRMGIALVRPIFLHVLGWTSRWVETPLGRMHIYDTGPGKGGGPTVLLQHGMFCTSWSVAPLGWLLSRSGRRVVMPDLFDFDNGLSASSTGQVRRPADIVEGLLAVVQDLVKNGAPAVDFVGHSFGAFVVALLAERCRRMGVPARRVVLMGPGGPVVRIQHSPVLTRFIQQPVHTVVANLPRWVPRSIIEGTMRIVLGVLFSPNNCNILFGQLYSEYVGEMGMATPLPTLFLWGDEDSVAMARRERYLGPFLRGTFPNVDGVWVQGGGHNIQMDSLATVARAVNNWLREEDSGVCVGRPMLAVTGRGAEERGGGLVEMLLRPTLGQMYPMDLGVTGPRPDVAEPALVHAARL